MGKQPQASPPVIQSGDLERQAYQARSCHATGGLSYSYRDWRKDKVGGSEPQ